MSLIQIYIGKERRFKFFLLRNNRYKSENNKELTIISWQVPTSHEKQTHMLFSKWRRCRRISIAWKDTDGLMFWEITTGSQFGEEKQSDILWLLLFDTGMQTRQPCLNRGTAGVYHAALHPAFPQLPALVLEPGCDLPCLCGSKQQRDLVLRSVLTDRDST